MVKSDAPQESKAISRSKVDRSSTSHSDSDDRVAMTSSTNIQSREKPTFNRIASWREGLEGFWSSNIKLPLRVINPVPGKNTAQSNEVPLTVGFEIG